jgi:hypothetical protein
MGASRQHAAAGGRRHPEAGWLAECVAHKGQEVGLTHSAEEIKGEAIAV